MARENENAKKLKVVIVSVTEEQFTLAKEILENHPKINTIERSDSLESLNPSSVTKDHRVIQLGDLQTRGQIEEFLRINIK